MGCLKATVIHQDDPIIANVERIGGGITALINAIETSFKAIVNRTGEQLKVITERIHSPLSVNVSVVCSLSDFYYMDVSPGDIQWITSDDVIMYTVTSNVDWEVIEGIEEEDYITTLTNDMLISNDTLLVNYRYDIIAMFSNENEINNGTIIKNRYEA